MESRRTDKLPDTATIPYNQKPHISHRVSNGDECNIFTLHLSSKRLCMKSMKSMKSMHSQQNCCMFLFYSCKYLFFCLGDEVFWFVGQSTCSCSTKVVLGQTIVGVTFIIGKLLPLNRLPEHIHYFQGGRNICQPCSCLSLCVLCTLFSAAYYFVSKTGLLELY